MRTERFDKALDTVNAERGENYGSPLTNFQRMALVWELVKDCKDKEVRHALYMVGLNVARLVETPTYEDGPIDIGGYARTIPMILDERDGS